MIKVMLLFYGLVVFVPDNGGLTVLFVDEIDPVAETEHVPKAEAVGRTEMAPLLAASGSEFEIVINGPAGEIDLSAREHFVQLEELFTYPRRGLITEACIGNRPACRKGSEDLVRGRVRVEGTWSSQPATYCEGAWSYPVTFSDEAQFQFRRRSNGQPRTQETRSLATALRLETEVTEDQLAELLEVNGQVFGVDELPAEICERWMGRGVSRCAVLVLGQDPHPVPQPGPTPAGFRQLDEHFSAFYRLTRNPPWQRNRWLPFLYAKPCCPEGFPRPPRGVPTNWPAKLCPPTFATAEP